MQPSFFVFFSTHTATTEIYTLSLHDALPISRPSWLAARMSRRWLPTNAAAPVVASRVHCTSGRTRCLARRRRGRSEEHTSELQSRRDLVCRLLLEKKKIKNQLLYTLTFTNSG